MSSVNLDKAALPTIPNASGSITIPVTTSADAGTDLSVFSGKFVRVFAEGADIFLSAETGLSSSVTAPTNLAGANPGLPVLQNTFQDFFIPTIGNTGPGKGFWVRTIGSASGNLHVFPTSR